MTVDELNLAEPAKSAAAVLQAKHPGLVFTSGRRDVAGQARAMAGNVARNRQWIVQTYANTFASRTLQKVVDDNPQATSPQAIEAMLAAAMAGWSDGIKALLSKHFSGQAFDVQPMPDGPRADTVKADIRALRGLTKFLEMEGGLVRWHAQFA